MGSIPESEGDRSRLLIPSLYVSQLSTRPVGILMGFILIEIAATYATTVGVAGQIPTAASLAGLIVSPFLAALSIKYRPRNLLLAGIAFITISTLGCSFAGSYASLLIFYALSGLGAAMVAPMISTIVGENVPEERRAGVLGILNTSTPILSSMVGLTITWILRGGWQDAYRYFASPIIVACLILSVLGLRKVSPPASRGEDTRSISGGFRMIMGNRSAVACLLGTALIQMMFNGIMWYVMAFYRQHWGLSPEFAGVIWSSNTIVYVLGSMLVGRVVPKFGRKKLTGLTSLCTGLIAILYANAPHPYISIASNLTISTLLAFWSASSSDLALAQVPEYSGAMMSLNSGAIRLGGVFGSAVGGLLLTLGGYSLLGAMLGIAGIGSFFMIFLFAKDPSSNNLSD